jgi:acetylornithine deacetylase
MMWNAHLDTVGVQGMEAPFEPRERDGRMTARGAMDMKASLAACLLALHDLQRDGALRGDVVVAAVADEEHDSIGTRAALAALPELDLAVVTEPTDLTLHVAHRGFAVVDVELEGRASHTSQPERGVNAVTRLGRLLAAIEAADRELRAAPPHPLLGQGGWQAVMASGGTELFTTPARASASLERRTLPGESAVGAEAEVVALLNPLAADDPRLGVSSRTVVAREAFEAAADDPAVAAVAAAAEAVTGRPPERRGAPYWTDAALVAAEGVPTVLYGPVGGGIHQPDEWVDLASVEVLRSVLARLAHDVCG